MLLLMLFALIAGAGTAITPCVLPVLPALLSASGVGGRRRPAGIVLGMTVTFAISIIALSSISRHVGLGNGVVLTLSWIALLGFGVVMLVPALAMRVQAPLSRLARFGPKSRGDGFPSGIAVGAALGFVCAPCGSPIVGAVIAAGNSGRTDATAVGVGIAFALGLGAILTLYALGGQRAAAAIRRRTSGHAVERTLGVVLVLTGVVIAFNLDNKIRNIVAGHTGSGILAFFNDPTSSLETSHAVESRLTAIQPASRFVTRARHARSAATASGAVGVAIAGVQTPSLPDLGPAPELSGYQHWFNTPGGGPESLAGLRGHVVIVDFWTYTCINCIRTLPFVEGLYRHYHPYGLDIIGVESPEFTFEQEASNVQQAINADGLTYPVVQDNNLSIWNAFQNQYWPAEYYVDARGEVRHTKFGEGNYRQDEAAVRELLYEAGHHTLPPPMTAHAMLPSANLGTPETYLDPQRAQGFVTPLRPGVSNYDGPANPALNSWSLRGSWNVGSQSITPVGGTAEVIGGVQAQNVYLVMTSAGGIPRQGRVLLGGKPIPEADRGADVGPGGLFTVRGERLYHLVALPSDGQTVLTVQLPPGVSAYDFTFG